MGAPINITRIIRPTCLFVAALLLILPVYGFAQNFSGAFEGMQDSDQPIQIDADRLEVKDKEGIALFTGNVNVVQGATILKAKRLKVVYTRGSGGPGGNLKYLEATGKIAVRSGNQMVTANRGEFDMLKETVRLSGDVIISQGSNVASGCILDVDLKTNSAVLKPCEKQGRPTIIFDTKNAPRK